MIINNEPYKTVYPGILLAAPKSGSGKTLITCALLYALKRKGYSIQAFKCGPDYIDPMFHRKVLGVPSVNLDTWFTRKEGTRQLFARHMEEAKAEIGVIEGVMGLYDGLGGVTSEASSYDIAETLHLPIILIVDARGMGRSVIAEIKGFQSMDYAGLISGVILNRTSSSFSELIKPEIQKECGIPVIGSFPMDKSLHVDSRHLGLKLPGEIAELQSQVEGAADLLEQNVDLERLLTIAGADLQQDIDSDTDKSYPDTSDQESVRIAVAMDEAFCFYYEDNLHLLEQLGADIIPFSPLHDAHLPVDISGIYLGGGYPELKAEELSQNESMRQEIREAIQNDMPSIAECGGFMYLHEQMETQDGQSWPMVGALPGSSRYTGKLVRFGYCSVSEHHPDFLPEGKTIRGHEFHYYDSDQNGEDCTAMKPMSGRAWTCVQKTNHSWWGYPHLYWLSSPEYAEHFVECCRRWKEL